MYLRGVNHMIPEKSPDSEAAESGDCRNQEGCMMCKSALSLTSFRDKGALV